MAYFDSAKNRAMWERTLAGLREEKERRAATGYAPQNLDDKAKEAANPFRRRITLAQLEEIEREASGVRRVRRPTRQRQMENRMEMEIEMEAEQAAPKGMSL